MTQFSDSLDDLTSDLRHLTTLIDVITNRAIDAMEPDMTADARVKEVAALSDLLWIARDMAGVIADNSNAAHRRVLAEKSDLRKIGGARG